LERYGGIVRLHAAFSGGLLPLAPKSSGQPLRVCPSGLLRYPHEGIKVFLKRGRQFVLCDKQRILSLSQN
jgi:hypothetical protein